MTRTASNRSDLFVYLFIWDRYRMIAKDFILQISAAHCISSIWIRCIERMARWYIYMDYTMKDNGNFIQQYVID